RAVAAHRARDRFLAQEEIAAFDAEQLLVINPGAEGDAGTLPVLDIIVAPTNQDACARLANGAGSKRVGVGRGDQGSGHRGFFRPPPQVFNAAPGAGAFGGRAAGRLGAAAGQAGTAARARTASGCRRGRTSGWGGSGSTSHWGGSGSG